MRRCGGGGGDGRPRWRGERAALPTAQPIATVTATATGTVAAVPGGSGPPSPRRVVIVVAAAFKPQLPTRRRRAADPIVAAVRRDVTAVGVSGLDRCHVAIATARAVAVGCAPPPPRMRPLPELLAMRAVVGRGRAGGGGGQGGGSVGDGGGCAGGTGARGGGLEGSARWLPCRGFFFLLAAPEMPRRAGLPPAYCRWWRRCRPPSARHLEVAVGGRSPRRWRRRPRAGGSSVRRSGTGRGKPVMVIPRYVAAAERSSGRDNGVGGGVRCGRATGHGRARRAVVFFTFFLTHAPSAPTRTRCAVGKLAGKPPPPSVPRRPCRR